MNLVEYLREGVGDTGFVIKSAANINATMVDAADRIEALEQLAQDMLGFIELFGHKPGCRKNAFGDVCSCGIDKALSRYREVCGCSPQLIGQITSP